MGGADTALAVHPVRPAATTAARPAPAAPARMASVALRASIDPYLQLRARMSSTLAPAGSGEVAQQRPRDRPAGAQPGRPVDDNPLLVVADAQAVAEDG